MALFQLIFNVCWLLALLVLLILIWRSSERRLKHIQSMEVTMFDVAMKDAESTRIAVESLRDLITHLKEQKNDESH